MFQRSEFILRHPGRFNQIIIEDTITSLCLIKLDLYTQNVISTALFHQSLWFHALSHFNQFLTHHSGRIIQLNCWACCCSSLSQTCFADGCCQAANRVSPISSTLVDQTVTPAGPLLVRTKHSTLLATSPRRLLPRRQTTAFVQARQDQQLRPE